MATIQANSNPASRLQAGERVLEAAKTTDTSKVKAKLAAFAKAHAAFAGAERAARAAEAKRNAAEDAVGEADAAQDAAALALAAKMIGDGAPKGNPFKPLGLPAPSVLVKLAVREEAKLAARLARQAGAWKGASAQTKSAATSLGKAVAKVEAALSRLPALARAQAAALSQRAALGLPWARAFAHLKNAARAAEDDGQAGLFAALFQIEAKPARKPPPPVPPPLPQAPPPPEAPAG
jgi:hypothetical protein